MIVSPYDVAAVVNITVDCGVDGLIVGLTSRGLVASGLLVSRLHKTRFK